MKTADSVFGASSRVAAAYLLPLYFLAAITPAQQWALVNLHPAGAASSAANGVRGGRQAGTVGGGDQLHASLWSGTAASCLDLHPPGVMYSFVAGMDDVQQVGSTHSGAAYSDRACVWSGTADSWINLHPAGSSYSQAHAVSGGQQVGFIAAGGPTGSILSAALWTGSAGSCISLHPPEVGSRNSSAAYGTDGVQQVGYTRDGGHPLTSFRAALWSGTPESWVNLHPDAATWSAAYGVHAGEQVGASRVDGILHAALWRGTAVSWVDLHPAAAASSEASGVFSGQQVGVANVGGVNHASLWRGTSTSWLDLHALLPGDFSSSTALGIWHDGFVTYIVGYGHNDMTMRQEALMWIGPAACPGDLSGDSIVGLADLAVLLGGFGTAAGATYADGDLDADGDVDLSDLAILLAEFGAACVD